MISKKDFAEIADLDTQSYHNEVVSNVNDHVVRLSVMTAGYPWHLHPNSDETFIGVEGVVIIETDEGIAELTPGSCITIPKNVAHRTRPKTDRSVNLTVESADLETVFIENKD